MSPFTEYMNELELEATSEDDIHAGDETLDAIFAEDHALGVGDAQHRQVARQQRRKKGVISLRLEQWQPSLLSTMQMRRKWLAS